MTTPTPEPDLDVLAKKLAKLKVTPAETGDETVFRIIVENHCLDFPEASYATLTPAEASVVLRCVEAVRCCQVYEDLIDKAGLAVCCCMQCGEARLAVPDGLTLCEKCASLTPDAKGVE